jgi:two-component SAPR family response regulator
VRGEYRDALAVYEEGLAVARRAGDLRVQASTAEGIATIYRNVGAYQRAEPLYETAWRITRESEPSVAIYYRSMQAEMYRWQGEMAEAFRLLEQARDMALEKGLDFQRRGPLTIAEGVTRVAAGQVERGLALLTTGVEFLEQRQSKSELSQAYFLLAEAYLLSQDRPAAVAALRRALALAEEIGTDQFAVVEGQHVPALLELGVSEGLSHCRILQEKVAELRSLRAVLLRDGTGEETRGEGALEIYAFGEGRVVRDGRAISSSAWKAAMAKELFFYILLHGPLERDALGLVFWPDLSTKRMTDSFHSTLYRVRRAVGGDAVINDGGVYRIGDLDYWFDVAEFEALVQRARLLPPHDWQAEDLWRRAVRLYADDFLADVDRLWALSKREALREMYLEALVALGRCYETRRAFEEAIRWYKQALAVDDLREDVHRRVMRCYAAAGRRSAALAQYQTCREILARDLGVAPMEETERLYHSLADQA